MAQGMELLGSGKSLLLKDKTGKIENIEFFKILRAYTGFLCALEGNQVQHHKNDNDRKVLTTSKKSIKKQKIGVKKLRKLLRHPNHKTVLKTANYYAIETTGKQQKCESCLKGKMKTSIIPKVNNSKTIIPGKCFYFDISSTKEKRYGGSQYWVLIVNEASRMKWSHFIKKNLKWET